MNELNLQNPEFRNYIHQVIYDYRGLVVIFILNSPKALCNLRIYLISPNKPLGKNQRWFTIHGEEILSLNGLQGVGEKIGGVYPCFI
jgi:hypothetical protein